MSFKSKLMFRFIIGHSTSKDKFMLTPRYYFWRHHDAVSPTLVPGQKGSLTFTAWAVSPSAKLVSFPRPKGLKEGRSGRGGCTPSAKNET